MKNKIYILILAFIGIYMASCEPVTMERPEISTPPSESQMSFSITPGDDDFHVVITNTSSVNGIANWDLGNGMKVSGDEVVANYQLEGTYTIQLFLVTNGGTGIKSQDYEQPVTDFSIFTDPLYIMLSGGVDAVNGKTWVIDSLEGGHYGVGPEGGDWPEWWGASILQKTNGGCYDDKFNFNINQFVFTDINNSNNYVSLDISDQTYYSNHTPVDGSDVLVTYNPTPGSWSISEEEGVRYLILNGTTPLYFGFDNGIVNGKYRIDEISENLLKVSGIGFDANRWYYQLIPDGYVKPKIEYDLTVTATGNTNEFNVSLSNVTVPSELTIDNIIFDFGNGSSIETTDETAVHTTIYMRAGTYTVTSTIVSGEETIIRTHTEVVATNHPSYVEYLLDAMVMYNDFGETTIMAVNGEDCSVDVVENPDKSIWPNRSNNVAKYTKVNNQWANANMELPVGYRFDLRQQHIFKILVYGTAGETVLLKLENTDKGGDAWQTGTELTYVIQESNKWEVAEYDFLGADVQPGAEGWKWWPEPVSYDVVNDPFYNNGWYNIVRIMYQPGDDSQEYSFYFDDLAGPHVEGLK